MSLHPFSLSIKPVGSRCNLNCDYCYYLAHNKSERMNANRLAHIVKQHIDAQPEHTSQVGFIWHGGEPMMRGLGFYRQVVNEQNKHASDKTIINTIQTNGTLITDTWARFFADHNFMVGISLDGQLEIHNIARMDISGQSTFDKTLQGIERLKEYRVPFNTLSVINNRTYQHAADIYHFLKSIGSEYMQFQPLR